MQIWAQSGKTLNKGYPEGIIVKRTIVKRGILKGLARREYMKELF